MLHSITDLAALVKLPLARLDILSSCIRHDKLDASVQKLRASPSVPRMPPMGRGMADRSQLTHTHDTAAAAVRLFDDGVLFYPVFWRSGLLTVFIASLDVTRTVY